MLRWLGLAALLYGAAYYIVSRLIYQPARLLSLDLGPLAPNVMLQPHAPLSDILPIADALVLNGNSESVLAALQAGLPAVVLL
jgi:UDP:flavonoid glycosyltransferase YjiC (YdhE family)